MDFTARLDPDYVPDEFETETKRQSPQRLKKRYRTRKGRKPQRPEGHIGLRSNKRLKKIWDSSET